MLPAPVPLYRSRVTLKLYCSVNIRHRMSLKFLWLRVTALLYRVRFWREPLNMSRASSVMLSLFLQKSLYSFAFMYEECAA